MLCNYDNAPVKEGQKPNLTMFKTLDKTIKAGDIVMVPSETRHKITTVKVIEEDVEVDHDNTKKVDWIVGKLNTDLAQSYIDFETKILAKVKSADKAKRQRELRESLTKDKPELEGLVAEVESGVAALMAPAPAVTQS